VSACGLATRLAANQPVCSEIELCAPTGSSLQPRHVPLDERVRVFPLAARELAAIPLER
jgi:hypothetical protein